MRYTCPQKYSGSMIQNSVIRDVSISHNKKTIVLAAPSLNQDKANFRDVTKHPFMDVCMIQTSIIGEVIECWPFYLNNNVHYEPCDNGEKNEVKIKRREISGKVKVRKTHPI